MECSLKKCCFISLGFVGSLKWALLRSGHSISVSFRSGLWLVATLIRL